MKKKEQKMLMLDKEQIAARRVPLEDAQISSTKDSLFHCHYCSKNFHSEHIFMRHVCLQKKKALQFVSPVGQAAFAFYNDWMHARKYSKQTGDAFLASRMFTSFVKFAEFVKNTDIRKPDRYLRIMVDKNIQPPLWCTDGAYKLYLESFDLDEDPIKEVQDTINFLIDLCIKENVLTADGHADLSKIVSTLGPQRILNYIRNKSITPWIIFTSESFKVFIRNLDDEHRKNLDNIIKISYWFDKLTNNTKATKDIKEICAGLGM